MSSNDVGLFIRMTDCGKVPQTFRRRSKKKSKFSIAFALNQIYVIAHSHVNPQEWNIELKKNPNCISRNSSEMSNQMHTSYCVRTMYACICVCACAVARHTTNRHS